MNHGGLIAILEEARALLERPDNDFAWSSWTDSQAALAELDGLVAGLRAGAPPDRAVLDLIFAPTGPMQEVGLGSGWGEAFLRLADRYDREIARARPTGRETGA